jgi:hypothetical protein
MSSFVRSFNGNLAAVHPAGGLGRSQREVKGLCPTQNTELLADAARVSFFIAMKLQPFAAASIRRLDVLALGENPSCCCWSGRNPGISQSSEAAIDAAASRWQV